MTPEIQDLLKSLDYTAEGSGHPNTLCARAAVTIRKLIDERDRLVWLIEAPGQRYLSVREMACRHDFIWTQDHNKALQFKSGKQADLMMSALRDMDRTLFGFDVTLGPARATEHSWLGQIREKEGK
jgi:hypothetical protein